ncbi:MAG: cell division protein FtsA [Anaerolineales bacterium]|nr:cell division protein FtsA [Anaerolineales bacterium]MBX3004260.1 cell division protein FtsA [Anaerolineales bacterium]MCW5839207.1 cell division protein FtsA [Anaerolineales bacterium]
MAAPIVVGIDIGTTKICTIVARVEQDGRVRVLGVGNEPSQGVRKGTVVDINAVTRAISHSIDKAERSSGLEITSALVSLAGAHVSSANNIGAVGIANRVISHEDVGRALEVARAVAIPHNREVVHVIQRGFVVDGQDGIAIPVGMHGYRLEAQVHIITAASSVVDNLRQCVAESNVGVSQFVLNPLASAEAVLTPTEREMGVVVCDIGGGTTDMALLVEGDVLHTSVLGVGGNHVTSDIAHGLRLPFSQAEEIKLRYGHALPGEIDPTETFAVKAVGASEAMEINRHEMSQIIEARMEEVFTLLHEEIGRTGYAELLPAGVVLTGGSSLLKGLPELASRVLHMPVRVGQPDKLTGMVDKLQSPAYATSVGLLKWAVLMNEVSPNSASSNGTHGDKSIDWKEWVKRFLP